MVEAQVTRLSVRQRYLNILSWSLLLQHATRSACTHIDWHVNVTNNKIIPNALFLLYHTCVCSPPLLNGEITNNNVDHFKHSQGGYFNCLSTKQMVVKTTDCSRTNFDGFGTNFQWCVLQLTLDSKNYLAVHVSQQYLYLLFCCRLQSNEKTPNLNALFFVLQITNFLPWNYLYLWNSIQERAKGH